MMTVLEHINAFWAAYGEWITVALIPTIVAGLTISPSTKEAAGWVQKIWNGIKTVMNFLSVLTHKDQAGTFQLPLKLGKVLPKKKEESVEVVVEETSEEKKGE